MDRETIIIWIKRVLAVITIAMWLFVIVNISQIGGDFNQQMMYCMASTMAIFGLLTGAFKLLERFEVSNS
ncbi:hypothetical protein MNB_SV-15-741 [hydrothermal vent metagenome]|uniref:Uncharacterized protein n=1 Tax=hydrothermal vent metagenome TaxID=652676 RepID=A0A1W1EKN4_9ZZZZ